MTLTSMDRRQAALVSLQRYAEARDTQLRILAVLSRQGADVPLDRRLRLLDAAAEFYQSVNDLDTADQRIHAMRSLLGDDPARDYWRGRLARRQGQQAMALGRWDEADRLLAQAQELQRGNDPPGGATQVGLEARRCEVQLRAGQEPASCARLASQLTVLDTAAPRERVFARLALAAHARAAGRPEEAHAHLLQALAAAQAPAALRLQWTVLDALSVHLRGAGDAPRAVALAKLAVARIEAVRRDLGADLTLQGQYLRDKYTLYRRLADWLTEDGRLDEALQVLRLLKGREAQDFIRSRSDAAPPASGPLARPEGEARWLDRLPRDRPLRPAQGSPSEDLQQALADEQRAAAAWARALTRPLATAPAAWRLAPPPPAATPEAGTLRATLFHGPAHLNLVIETAQRRHLVRLPSDPRAFAQDLGSLHRRLEAREDVMPALRDLHARVAAPLENEARRSGATRWTLRLDGDLRYLPFAALHDGRQFLVERYVIAQQSFAGGVGADDAAAAWLQALGSTRAGEGLAALPGVADEICGIVDGPVRGGACQAPDRSGAVPGEAWLDDAFTRERLKSAWGGGRDGRRDLLHVGSHFVLRAGEIGRSWLLLGDGTRLPLHELLSWPLQSVDLVVLAACQTGVGGGAELEGLSTLVLERGASTVLASLWALNDGSTSALMRAFYGRMRSSADAASALRDAQLQMLGSRDAAQRHPFHWAAFFVTHRGK